MDRKEALPTLPEIDSPPMSPKKQFRPMKTMDSYNSQEGRSVEELKALIKSVLQHNYQAFEEVRLKKNGTIERRLLQYSCYVDLRFCIVGARKFRK